MLYVKLFVFISIPHTVLRRREMSVDKFGRHSTNVQSIRGPKGDGFEFTFDGNYDIQNKKLCNVAGPSENTDAVNLKFLKDSVDNCLVITGDHFNAQNKRVCYVSDPVTDKDAVNLHSLKSIALTKQSTEQYDAHNVAITNVGTPNKDQDAVNLKYLHNNALLVNPETNNLNANGRIISNLSKPNQWYDAVHVMYLEEKLSDLGYAVYNQIHKKRKNKLTKIVWKDKYMKNRVWDEMFALVETPIVNNNAVNDKATPQPKNPQL